jgi:hypothetical protein
LNNKGEEYMPKRLIIPIEFSANKEDEISMYLKLKSFTNPASIIKDILKGNLSPSILSEDKK